ncbi:hypothetical protein V1525DRAFT_396827 [Lipomyces kononenkoae]|uniref:Uncharacterized protein n=1 Tax=Lipomyces kononenkoae TaxID=34357 RepID=A0ACC3T864_LIPKO
MRPHLILFVVLSQLLSVPRAANQRISWTNYAHIAALSLTGRTILSGIYVDAVELPLRPDQNVPVVDVHDNAAMTVPVLTVSDDEESLDKSGTVAGLKEPPPRKSDLQSTDASVDSSADATGDLKEEVEKNENARQGQEKLARSLTDDNAPAALKPDEDQDHNEAEVTKHDLDNPQDAQRPSRPVKLISLPIVEGTGYKPKSQLELACMVRDIDNGEHITDANSGMIIYNSFPLCKETNRPLSFAFGVDSDNRVNCTFGVVDEFYHMLQLYVHQDAPLSCRVPARLGSEHLFAPVVFSVQGKLEQSHLDIATKFNIIFTYADGLINGKPSKKSGANVTSAVAYPIHPSSTTRLIIGDELTMQFNVRWFPITRTPKQEDKNVASFAILCYCVASGVVAFAVAAFYFLVIVFPQRARARSAMRQAIAAGLAPDFSIFSTGYASSTKRD